jgi:2-polyprenyl-6-methoxyphenol hydroxylase-like FAD-dependent oxidoreductase
MMLAYQLASNGVAVRVLERHQDFDREFRGEFVQPSVIESLERLGIVTELRRRGRVLPIRAVRMSQGTHAFASSVGADGGDAGLVLHQPSFLALLHDCCRLLPHYRLDLGCPVTGVTRNDGRVSGVSVRRDEREEHIAARLVVVCNGRGSSLRKAAGVTAEELERPYTLLWLRFDLARRPELVPDTLEGYVTKRAFCVLYPTYGAKAQLMWRRARRHPLDWKAPLEDLRARLLEDVPDKWRPIVRDVMSEDTERQPLRVVCDRLRTFFVPGALFLGDAAHTMSPIGGQGLTVAIRDAVVAANHIVRAERDGAALDDALCARIEAERRPEIEKLQAFQVRAGRINDAPGPVQWLMSRAIIPLATRLQGASYMRELQHGVTRVDMSFPVPIAPEPAPRGAPIG